MSQQNRVVRATAPVESSTVSPLLRRCGGSRCSPNGCDHDGEESQLQRHAAGVGPELAPPVVHDVLRSSGQPLDETTQASMGRAFGRDFSHVRVHTDARAAQAAHAVRARAFTVGPHVVFAPYEYAPATGAGQRLLAHELTHVVQQPGMPTLGAPLKVGDVDAPAEREAASRSDSVSRGLPATGATATPPQVHRQAAVPGSGIPANDNAAPQSGGGGACADLIANPGTNLLGGATVHALIEADFAAKVPGALRISIPGASARPQRTGRDSPVVPPQVIGGRAGTGYPDLARRNPAGVLSVAEIKPALPSEIVDGETQLARYVDNGNAQDSEQVAWRAGHGITVVSPMLPQVYTPTPLVSAGVNIRTCWLSPGLLIYASYPRRRRIRVPVTAKERQQAKERHQSEAGQLQPAPVPAPAPAPGTAGVAVGVGVGVAVVAGRALWPHFWRAVVARFALMEGVAVALALVDGPLPVGDLIALGMNAMMVIQIGIEWNELWRQADAIAQREGA